MLIAAALIEGISALFAALLKFKTIVTTVGCNYCLLLN
jgi:hypothetical protein